MTGTQIPEGLELHKDGTVTVHLDSERIRLRRPKFREFRQLRDARWELADRVNATLADQRAELRDLRARLDGTAEDELADVQDEIRAATSKIRRDAETVAGDNWARWTVETIELLADRTVDVDDLPPWCSSADFSLQLEEHWITVPTRRGAT